MCKWIKDRKSAWVGASLTILGVLLVALFIWVGTSNAVTIIISVVGGALVAWGASYYGAKAGGEISKNAAIEGAREGARANLYGEELQTFVELYRNFWLSARGAQQILSDCQTGNTEDLPKRFGDYSSFYFDMLLRKGDLAIDEEERAFLAGIDYLTSSHVRKLFPKMTRGEFKEYFDNQPKTRDAILGIGETGERGELYRKLNDKLGILMNETRAELKKIINR